MKRRPKEDHVDTILKQWRRERPELDVSPMGIIGRISRAERLIDEQMKNACAQFNLERWEFDVLASLRRAGRPYQLTPTQLYHALMLTSGAMTNRIDHLEAAGLVKRLRDPADRRGVLVSLTKDGLKLIDKAVTTHMEVEEAMLASLSAQDREAFAQLLRALSHDLEAMKQQPKNWRLARAPVGRKPIYAPTNGRASRRGIPTTKWSPRA